MKKNICSKIESFIFYFCSTIALALLVLSICCLIVYFSLWSFGLLIIASFAPHWLQSFCNLISKLTRNKVKINFRDEYLSTLLGENKEYDL